MQKTVINDKKLKKKKKSQNLIAQFKYLLSAYCGPGTVIVHKITVSVLPEEIHQKRYSHKQKIPVYITCSERSKYRKIF